MTKSSNYTNFQVPYCRNYSPLAKAESTKTLQERSFPLTAPGIQYYEVMLKTCALYAL